jgi:eukaryotic-like serine/threonine-protein kinase
MELKGEIGKYRILRKLGSGGFGTVYLAEDSILKCPRALKIPHRTASPGDKLLQECILQTRLLDHPNIVKLLTVDIIDRLPVMVMEYVDGSDLEKIIDARNTLETATALHFLGQILSALAFAHQKSVIHRDIRPSNILITKENQVKITDFGTSALLQDRAFATTRIGSPPYMAPEQFEGKAVFASDIYSVGCLFYEMMSGFPPIVLANPMEIYKRAKAGDIPPLMKKVATVTPELNRIAMTMLSPDLAVRYASANQVLDDLGRPDERSGRHELEIADIQSRIRAHETKHQASCWNCRKSLGPRIKTCPYCGEPQ